jgi:hypothetical protein
VPARNDSVALRQQVRRDVRAFAIGVAVSVIAAAVALLWQIHVLGATTAAPIALITGSLGVTIAFVAWAHGNRRIRDRLFVAAPAFLSAPALVAAVTHYSSALIGFLISFVLALAAAAAFGYSGVIRRRRRPR